MNQTYNSTPKSKIIYHSTQNSLHMQRRFPDKSTDLQSLEYFAYAFDPTMSAHVVPNDATYVTAEKAQIFTLSQQKNHNP